MIAAVPVATLETPEVEEAARKMPYCACCGVAKDVGLVVCWRCFKYETPSGRVAPLKYAGMTFLPWLLEARP